jgi:hypothetical protein
MISKIGLIGGLLDRRLCWVFVRAGKVPKCGWRAGCVSTLAHNQIETLQVNWFCQALALKVRRKIPSRRIISDNSINPFQPALRQKAVSVTLFAVTYN